MIIDIDKEIKNIQQKEYKKIEQNSKKYNLSLENFEEFFEEEDASFLFNFINDTKNGIKRYETPIINNTCKEIDDFIKYFSTYLVNNKITSIIGIFEHIIANLKKKDKKIVTLDNNIDKIDYNKLAETILDENIKWNFIIKSKRKIPSKEFLVPLNLKKKWKPINILNYNYNLDIINIKINLLKDSEDTYIIFDINLFHTFKVKINYKNIIEIINCFNEGINMNCSSYNLNENFSIYFDDIMFILNINNNLLETKIYFYNNTVLRTELKKFIDENKKDFMCILT
jgi:hypothetical protein